MILWPDKMIADMLSTGVQLYWCSALDRGYVARLTWIIFQLEQHIWYITMKLLRRLWNLDKRWQSSLLMSSSSFAFPGHHDDEIMRGGEAMKEWDLDQHFLKREWWTSWSDEVIKGKYCFRQDLEVPKEGNYFSFKGDPRSETNQEVKRKVKWLDMRLLAL